MFVPSELNCPCLSVTSSTLVSLSPVQISTYLFLSGDPDTLTSRKMARCFPDGDTIDVTTSELSPDDETETESPFTLNVLVMGLCKRGAKTQRLTLTCRGAGRGGSGRGPSTRYIPITS